MRRDPSIHITKSNLVRILESISFDVRTNKVTLAEAVFKAAAPYQIRDRYLEVLEQKTEVRKKIERSVKADSEVKDSDVGKMNMVIHTVRTALNPHIQVKPILRDSKDYLMLKEITVLAVRFCDTFGIDNKQDGFKEYVSVGLGMMRKYALNRFKYYDSKIHENLQNRIILVNDPNREDTQEFLEMLETAMEHYAGMPYKIKDEDLDSRINIYHARVQADEVGADYEDWIIGQFEGLAFLNVLPELGQFFGDNAQGRWKKWLNTKAAESKAEQTSVTAEYKEYEEE